MTICNQLFSYLLPENKEYKHLKHFQLSLVNSIHKYLYYTLLITLFFLLAISRVHTPQAIMLHRNYIVWYFKSQSIKYFFCSVPVIYPPTKKKHLVFLSVKFSCLISQTFCSIYGSVGVCVCVCYETFFLFCYRNDVAL